MYLLLLLTTDMFRMSYLQSRRNFRFHDCSHVFNKNSTTNGKIIANPFGAPEFTPYF